MAELGKLTLEIVAHKCLERYAILNRE
jgi:hypothetical protein